MADFPVEIPESDAAARERVAEVMDTLTERVEGIRRSQAEAMAVTGSATSRDGSVSATVDATGVLTGLNFAASALQRNTPEKLARAVVAVAQQAAANARGQVGASLAELSEKDDSVAAARRNVGVFGVAPATVPAVPRTESDPTGMSEGWRGESPETTPEAPQRGTGATTGTSEQPSFEENSNILANRNRR